MRIKKRTIIFCVLVLFFVVLLMNSCKPTPTEAEVINKNDSMMESEIQESATTDTVIELEIPTRYQQSFSAYDGKLEVAIDANVEFPDVTAFPVYEFVYKPFSQQQVDLMIKELMGDADLYAADYRSTKSELETELILMKKELNDMKNGNVDPLSEGGSGIEEYEQMIKDWEQQIIDAPETNTNIKITSQEYSEQNNNIDVVARAEGKGDMAFSIYDSLNASELSYYVSPVFYQVGSFAADDLDLTISKEQAVDLAQKNCK